MKAALATGLVLLLVACATPPMRSAPMQHSCVQLFQQLDTAVDAAGVRDGGEYAVPGFPWARSNRFLASFAHDLTAQQAPDWLQRLRQLDQQARGYELARLNHPHWPLESLSMLQQCGDVLLRQTLQDPVAMAALKQAVAVPDDYSWLARAAGLYPLSRSFLRLGIAGYQQDVEARFAQVVAEPQGRWHLWQLASVQAAVQPINWSLIARDELGVPQLNHDQLQQLFVRYAPAFVVDENGDYDRPGRPLAATRTGQRPGFDTSQPKLYTKLAWTRWGDQVLPQLVYSLWFSQRPSQGALDPYSGALDGVMWRVTLDKQGQPLIYDTVHACGCYHYHFPAQDLAIERQISWGHEPLLFPQGQVPWSRVAVVLQSATHYVQRVVPLIAAQHMTQAKPQGLQLRDYDDLRHQQTADDQVDSLFAADGLVPGSERLERWWLWPSGVYSPGAMRQWGRHATAFVGRAHFDDPYFLENLGLAAPLNNQDKN